MNWYTILRQIVFKKLIFSKSDFIFRISMKIQHGKWSSFSILWHQDFSPIWGATEPFVSYLIHFFSYDHLIYHFRRLRHYIFWEEHKSTQYSAHMNRKGVVTLICLTLYLNVFYTYCKWSLNQYYCKQWQEYLL